MREIKFRIWDKNIPTVEEANKGLPPSGEMVQWEYVKKTDYLIDGLEGKYPIMQYIGFKDKNGKEIYEGDIVKVVLDEFFEIKFIQGAFVLYSRIRCAKFNIDMFLNKNIEVLGNIYKNQNLLSP